MEMSSKRPVSVLRQMAVPKKKVCTHAAFCVYGKTVKKSKPVLQEFCCSLSFNPCEGYLIITVAIAKMLFSIQKY